MQPERTALGARGTGVDATALARTVRRLAAAGQVPWLHAEAARRMAERLPLIKVAPSVVLDWSGPAGDSRELLRSRYPRARVAAVVASGAAATAAMPGPRGLRRLFAAPQARPLSEDAVPAGEAELVWSNMHLHLQEDPQVPFERWHRATAVGGFLMFATLGPGSLPELRDIHRAEGWGDALAPLIDMHDLGDLLVRVGFADPVMDQERLTLTWPDADALLRELRGLGGNVSPQRHAGLRTPRWRERLLAALRARGAGGRPQLTFELVYGHAFRAAPRVPVRGETSVSLDDLRSSIRAARP